MFKNLKGLNREDNCEPEPKFKYNGNFKYGSVKICNPLNVLNIFNLKLLTHAINFNLLQFLPIKEI